MMADFSYKMNRIAFKPWYTFTEIKDFLKFHHGHLIQMTHIQQYLPIPLCLYSNYPPRIWLILSCKFIINLITRNKFENANQEGNFTSFPLP